MKLMWFVALGGAVGSVTRFLISASIQERVGTTLPVGTLVVNITGSLIVGFLLTYALGNAAVSPEIRALLTTGFCGGYTTFSTFSYDTVAMMQLGDYRRAFSYIALSVILSLAGAFAGIYIGRSVLAARN